MDVALAVVCPHCGQDNLTAEPAPEPDQPPPERLLIGVPRLSPYHSNEATTALTFAQKLWRWKTVKAGSVTLGLHASTTWLTFKIWPVVSGESVRSTSSIGSFSGAQSLNDLTPVLFLAVAAMAVMAVPILIGVWWWRREPYRMPWDVPIASAGEAVERSPVVDIGPTFAFAD